MSAFAEFHDAFIWLCNWKFLARLVPDRIWCQRKIRDASKKDVCDAFWHNVPADTNCVAVYDLSAPALPFTHMDTSDVRGQTKRRLLTCFQLPNSCVRDSSCLYGEPDAAFAEHMMTGIPSCSGLDVIPNTGLRNASENNTQFAKWMSGCLAASHSKQQQQEQQWASTHKPVRKYASGLRLGSALQTDFCLPLSVLLAKNRTFVDKY